MILCNLNEAQIKEIQLGIRRLVMAVGDAGRAVPKNAPQINGVWSKETAQCSWWIRSEWENFTSTEKKLFAVSLFNAELLDIESTEQALDHIAAIDVEAPVAA